MEPLAALPWKNAQFHWLTEVQYALKQLKLAFTTARVLAHPDMTQAFVVEANTSSMVIGAVLSQRHRLEQIPHSIAYYLRKLTPVERNSEILDKEFLAIKDHLQRVAMLLGRGRSSDPRVYQS